MTTTASEQTSATTPRSCGDEDDAHAELLVFKVGEELENLGLNSRVERGVSARPR